MNTHFQEDVYKLHSKSIQFETQIELICLYHLLYFEELFCVFPIVFDIEIDRIIKIVIFN